MAGPFAELGPLEPLMDACVHCGFCLPTCPSYLLLGQEMDSPRGRIYLMRAGVEERIDMAPAVVEHFDTCLGCMACETACPSGVRYAPLLEQTRASIERGHTRPAGERWMRRLLFAVLPFPRRLRLLAVPLALADVFRRWPALLSRLPPRMRAAISLAPTVTLADALRETPEHTAAKGAPRLRVGLVTGCVQRAFFGGVNRATARVLSAEGCEVVAPRSQGCCGALALHAGEDGDAREFARDLIARFDRADVDVVAVNAAGCGSAMKEYGHLLRHDPPWAERAKTFAAKVKDVTEVLAGLDPPRAPRRSMPLRVAYHDACHLAHAQGIRREPRQLLASIPDLTVRPITESEICCGSAGIFNLVQPEMAATLGRRKAGHIHDADPDLVVTSNPGCMLQLQAAARERGEKYRVVHIVELLDAAFAEAPPADRSKMKSGS
ncbi:MAG: 4Fe-4S dicluster domain-containing protein [Luteitalea sp.]|nr:4Fe-4S dicluster domain-containing protein [Luteitalea sp.]